MAPPPSEWFVPVTRLMPPVPKRLPARDWHERAAVTAKTMGLTFRVVWSGDGAMVDLRVPRPRLDLNECVVHDYAFPSEVQAWQQRVRLRGTPVEVSAPAEAVRLVGIFPRVIADEVAPSPPVRGATRTKSGMVLSRLTAYGARAVALTLGLWVHFDRPAMLRNARFHGRNKVSYVVVAPTGSTVDEQMAAALLTFSPANVFQFGATVGERVVNGYKLACEINSPLRVALDAMAMVEQNDAD